VPSPTHSSKADFIVLTHEGETKALAFICYPSTLRHKQRPRRSYQGLNNNADKLFQVTAVINTYLQHVFQCARKQFFPGTHSEYTSTIRSYQQDNKYGTFRTGRCLLIWMTNFSIVSKLQSTQLGHADVYFSQSLNAISC
jgi:hypothetical protein